MARQRRRSAFTLVACGLLVGCGSTDGGTLLLPLQSSTSSDGIVREPPALPPPAATGAGGSAEVGDGLGLSDAGGSAGMGNDGDGDDAGALDAGVADAGEVDAAPPCSASAERCDGLDNDCDGEVDQAETCATGCSGFSLDERTYMFCASGFARDAALEACAAQGMRLLWLETPAESLALIDAVSARAPAGDGELVVYIGASDAEDEGEWRWVGNAASPDGFQFWEGTTADDDGEPVNGAYAAWDDIEPNDQGGEDCGALSVRGGTTREPGAWDDRGCDEELPLVCEAP
ncbi:MAG: C-type lectin domain-containing protein [Polyangiaceae bacterium]